MIDGTKYAVIVATDHKGGYAKEGKIPWYYPEDFKHFREITTGHICVMGRNTYLDINERLGEKAQPLVLPNRESVVLTTTLKRISNAVIVRSIDELIDCTFHEARTVFFIGGGSIFDEGLKIADEVYLTIIPGDHGCNSLFPMEEVINNFIIESEVVTESGLTFIKYVRNC